MNRAIKLSLALLATAIFCFPFVASAQDGSSLDGYTPPPMFGAPRPVPPKADRPKPIRMPKLSVPATPEPEKKKETIKPAVKKKVEPAAPKKTVTSKKTEPKKVQPKAVERSPAPIVIPVKKPEYPKDLFQGKPVEKILEPVQVKETGKVEKNKVNPGIEPIDLIREQNKKEQPKIDPKFQGVVKGPKTMPSNKKGSVESEVLFAPTEQEKDSKNLLNRLTKLGKDEKKEPPVEPTEELAEIVPDNIQLPSFSILPDGRRKLNIIFTQKQEDLTAEHKYSLDKMILPLLKEDKTVRLNLQSYASPQEGKISSDRRIALSRAMAIRKHLLAKKIAANRIDVRSLGSQTDVQPMNRVEIFILN